MTALGQAISLGDNVEPILHDVAEECLDTMRQIADAAGRHSTVHPADPVGALGTVNLLNNPQAGRNLLSIRDEAQKAGHELSREPLIARVKVRAESGKEKTYYFARNFTVSVPGISLTSYNSGAPIGRLAALDVGDEFQLLDGEFAEVIEKGTYGPLLVPAGWDGKGNLIRHEGFSRIEVPSLRAVLEGSPAIGDPFASPDDHIVWSAPKRAALRGVGLRDQSVMDKVQDEIFRLPINSQVMLEGPPGTGKTTTLIKRLSQKIVLTREREDDYDVIVENQLSQGPAHRDSWIMFSPTVLLEHYLREAFARDNVPASMDRIQTWSVFRNDLARRALGLLRSGRRATGFLLDDEAIYLSHHALANQPELYAAFDADQRSTYLAEINAALTILVESNEPALKNAARRIRRRLGDDLDASLLTIYLEVDANSEDLRRWVNDMRGRLNEETDRRAQVLARRNPQFRAELEQFVGKIDSIAAEDDEEDDEGQEAGPTLHKSERLKRVFRASIRFAAVAAHRNRQVPRSSKFRPVVDWLGESAMPPGDLTRMGSAHELISAVNMISLTTRNYFTRLPQRYRAFRKATSTHWFLPEASDAVKLSPEELDLLVAVHLDAASELLSSPRVRGSLTQGNLQVLAPMLAEMRNQVVVDEATDFSPLQLRAMSSLTTPRIQSFFACGDFNQRLTQYGVAQRETLKWAVPGLEFKQVQVGYRQSKELRVFANRIVELAGGDLQETIIEGPRDAEGFEPTVYVSHEGSVGQSRWIAERIVEIDNIHQDLPSVAVFVPTEDLVEPVAAELRTALSETNIEVMACPGGRELGRESRVRVFAVAHIKGLEFEAAFFHSLQELAADSPGLFDKFLYVGASRAATFLGLACSDHLPAPLEMATVGLRETWGDGSLPST